MATVYGGNMLGTSGMVHRHYYTEEVLRANVDAALKVLHESPKKADVVKRCIMFESISPIIYNKMINNPQPNSVFTRCCMDRMKRVKSRVVELGRLGLHLVSQLKLTDYIAKGVSEDMTVVTTAGRSHPMRGAAYSILCMPFPMQVDCDDAFSDRLAQYALKELPKTTRVVDLKDRDSRKQWFPLKNHPGATNKANVFLSEVCKSLEELSSHSYWQFNDAISHLAGLCSDDQAAAVAMAGYSFGMRVTKPMHTAARLLYDPKGAKSLTLVIKSLGLNGTLVGAMLCEATCLQGRGVGAEGADVDRKYRCVKSEVDKRVHHLDKAKLRSAVRDVYATELPHGKMEFEERQDYWTKRWLWCVNGSHSRTIERLNPQYAIKDESLKGLRLHRKVFAEHMTKEIISDWDGKCYFTQSMKLEPGKTRFIYAGDSIAYFAFDYLLSAVEKAWLNKRVVLDPGAIGTYGMGRRLKRLKSRGGVNVMLDYDDMNSRHSNDSMRIVFEELIAHVEFTDPVGQKIIDSFDQCFMWSPELQMHERIAGTMMSGHRATTFINSVLNYAYIATVYPKFNACVSMHVGDDVFVLVQGYVAAYELTEACIAGGLRMNPMKQSIGEHTAEFLRVAYRSNHCLGYVMRAIASVVNGNWSNELMLGYQEGLETILSSAWTLANRSALISTSLLLKHSMRRLARCGGRVAEKLLIGEYIREGSAGRFYGRDTHSIEIDYEDEAVDQAVEEAIKTSANSATNDYLTHHAQPVEIFALTYLNTSIQKDMLKSSYSKTLRTAVSRDLNEEDEAEVRERYYKIRGMYLVDEVWNKEVDRGLLSGFPLLELVKNTLKRRPQLVHEMLTMLTGDYYLQRDIEKVAWGVQGRGCAIDGYLSWSDAQSIAKKCDGEMVKVTYMCYV
jgi:hypothetical protein